MRIFYALPKYSEDLDFSLLQPDSTFSLDKYLQAILVECEAIGLQVSVYQKTNTKTTAINSAFLKTNSTLNELAIIVSPQQQLFIVNEPIHLKIKIEVDTNPPLDFSTENKLLPKPFSCYVKCFYKEQFICRKNARSII